MRILDSIISAIERGVHILRARIHADVQNIEQKVEDDVNHIRTFVFGPLTPEEVEAYLVACSHVAPDATDWRSSITDLLKILDLDASMDARRALFTELSGKGTYGGSAQQNIWLHEQVMTRLAERERIPAERSGDA
jgi:hypothetical protein